MKNALFTVALSLVLAAPAAAQNLKLDFHDGLVTVDASNMPVRSILTEWGKIGGTKIVGAERLAGAPLTLKLVNVPEAKALESILRGAAGYMAAPRNAGNGLSMYDRILVMATSSAPAPAAAANNRPAGNNNAFGGGRFAPPRQRERPEQTEPDEAPEPDENPPGPPVFTFPAPSNQPGQFTNAPPQFGQPVIVNPQTGMPQTITINPAQPGAAPAMPTGASQPGVIVAPPPPQTGVRPPGGGR